MKGPLVVSSMGDLDNSVFDIWAGEQDSLVFDMSVKRESHGQMVGIFFSVDSALSVAMDILLLPKCHAVHQSPPSVTATARTNSIPSEVPLGRRSLLGIPQALSYSS